MNKIDTYNWMLAKLLLATVLTGILLAGLGYAVMFGVVVWQDYGPGAEVETKKIDWEGLGAKPVSEEELKRREGGR